MNVSKAISLATSESSIAVNDGRFEAVANVVPVEGVFDTRQVLEDHPELRVNKSVVLDVIYEEYCRRQEEGESFDAAEFCSRFPSYQASVGRLIQVREYLEEQFMDPDDEDGFPWPRVGDHFLGFHLLGRLGKGRFARVFLAREPALGDRQVAVKISQHGTIEASTLGRLNHPNVISIYSVQTDPQTCLSAVCMPYLGNATLLDVLDRVYAGEHPPVTTSVFRDVIRERDAAAEPVENPLAPDVSLSNGSYVSAVTHIGIQLANALAYVHSHGILHQDFKPSNVLLATGGRSLLLDFNLSVDGRLVSGPRGGTPAYMAPEQLRLLNDPIAQGSVDVRADVYALGIVLYELLAARHPQGPIPHLPASGLADVLLERMHRPIAPLRSVNPRVSRALAKVVESCLAFRPEDRPRDAATVAARLRAAIPRRQRLRCWISANPARGLSAAALALAIVATGMVIAESWNSPSAPNGHLTAASMPTTPEACLEHADDLRREGQHSDALEYYVKAGDLAENAVTWAHMALCNSRLGKHEQASYRYGKAIETGVVSAAIWNNYGYSLSKAQKTSVDHWLPAAFRAFSQAIRLDSRCQAAFVNRAELCLEIDRRKFRNDPRVSSGTAALLQGLADVRRAIAIGPETAELDHIAARIAARLSPRTEIPPIGRVPFQANPMTAICGLAGASALNGFRTEAIDFLNRGMERGLNPDDVRNDRAITPTMKADQRFRELLQRQRVPKETTALERLADPG